MAQVSFAEETIRPSRSKVRHSNTFPKSTPRRPGRLVPGKPMRASQTPRSQTCVEFGSCLPKQVSYETDYKHELASNNNSLPPTAIIDEGRQPSPVDQHLHWLEGKLRELQVITADQTNNDTNANQSNDNGLPQATTEPAIPIIPREEPAKLKKQPNYYCIAVQDLESSADDATPGNNTPEWDGDGSSKDERCNLQMAPISQSPTEVVDDDNRDASTENTVQETTGYADWTPTEQMSSTTPTSPTNLPQLLVDSPGSSQRERLDCASSEPRLNGGQSMAMPGTAVKICNEDNAATNDSGYVTSRLNISNGINGRLSTGESVSPATSPSISNSSPLEPGQGFPLGLNLTLSIFGPEGSADNLVGEDLWEFDGFSEGALSTPTPTGGSMSSKSVTPQDCNPPPPGYDEIGSQVVEEGKDTESNKRQGLQTLNVETWSMDTSSGLPPSPVDGFSIASSSCSRASFNPPQVQEIPREESPEAAEAESLLSRSSSRSLSRAHSRSSQSRSVSPSVSRSKSWTSSKRASFKKFVLDKAKAKLQRVNLRRGNVHT